MNMATNKISHGKNSPDEGQGIDKLRRCPEILTTNIMSTKIIIEDVFSVWTAISKPIVVIYTPGAMFLARCSLSR